MKRSIGLQDASPVCSLRYYCSVFRDRQGLQNVAPLKTKVKKMNSAKFRQARLICESFFCQNNHFQTQ